MSGLARLGHSVPFDTGEGGGLVKSYFSVLYKCTIYIYIAYIAYFTSRVINIIQQMGKAMSYNNI